MTKKRSIISYDKLTVGQKKELELDFPEGFLSNLTTIKTPKNEVIDALIWEKEEVVYLVKVNKAALIFAVNDHNDDDFIDIEHDDLVLDGVDEHEADDQEQEDEDLD